MSELSSVQKDKLMSDVRTFISDAEEVMRSTVDQADESTAEVRDRVLDLLQEARAELAILQKLAVTKAKEASKATDEYVHENPWKSVGIAAGIGLIIGLLVGRR
jgi:ElaB/YqjD/DUF883 family membrane-anchored ribosome-binding protein